MKKSEKDKMQIARKFKLMELNKTPERKKFEEEYSCYILSLRPDGIITPEDNKPLKWRIDTWYKVEKAKYEEVSHTYEMIKLRAKMNNAYVYGVWLPKEFNSPGSNQIDNPDLFYDLIMKYKFKI
jgi:hypothetical protein